MVYNDFWSQKQAITISKIKESYKIWKKVEDSRISFPNVAQIVRSIDFLWCS